MSFIDKYYAIFNNSVGQSSVTTSRAEFANLLGVFSKQEEQLDQLKKENKELKRKNANKRTSLNKKQLHINQLKAENEALKNNDVFSIRLFKDKADKYKQALTEIKEIALSAPAIDSEFSLRVLEKCEVIDAET